MRARIHYSGRDYTVTGRGVAEVQEQIEQGLHSGSPYWLPVDFGEGRPSDAMLLITPGTMIAVVAELDADAEADINASGESDDGSEDDHGAAIGVSQFMGPDDAMFDV